MKINEATVLRIKDLCSERNITINALAQRSGIPPTTLKNIIYGKSNNPGIATLKILCDGLNLTIKDFFDSDLFNDSEEISPKS